MSEPRICYHDFHIEGQPFMSERVEMIEKSAYDAKIEFYEDGMIQAACNEVFLSKEITNLTAELSSLKIEFERSEQWYSDLKKVALGSEQIISLLTAERDALQSSLRQAEERLKLACAFEIDDDIKIERTNIMLNHWKIIRRNMVLAKDGTWEFEPLPSSRNEAFIKATRYASVDEALEQIRAKGMENE